MGSFVKASKGFFFADLNRFSLINRKGGQTGGPDCGEPGLLPVCLQNHEAELVCILEKLYPPWRGQG